MQIGHGASPWPIGAQGLCVATQYRTLWGRRWPGRFFGAPMSFSTWVKLTRQTLGVSSPKRCGGVLQCDKQPLTPL